MTEVPFLTAIAILFVIIGPALLVAKGLRVSVVPALIVAGLAVGQLDIIDPDLMLELARLGIAFLVFTIAIPINTESIRTVVSDTEVVSVLQAIVLGGLGVFFVLQLGVALEFGILPDVVIAEAFTVRQAFFVGVAAALSSMIVKSALFNRPNTDIVHQNLSSEIDSFNDLLAVFILLVVSGGALALDPIATQLGYGVILFVAAIIFNRYLFGFIERLAEGSDEAMLISIIALLIAFVAAAAFLETSIVVGAFAAGIAVKHHPIKYSEAFNGLMSIREFFVAIFFATVGALVALPISLTGGMIAAGLVVLTVVVKPIVIGLLLVYNGYDRRSATITGLDLDHVGEFSLIVAIEAFVLGLLIGPVFEAIILAAAISMILSNVTHTYDEHIYRELTRRGWLGTPYHGIDDWNTVPDDISDHIVIVGYGRQGRRIARFLDDIDESYVVIENNPQTVKELRSDCKAYVLGDALEKETAEVAKLRDARLIISTADARPVSEYFLSFADSTDVIVRTRELPMAADLIERGAIYVIVPDLLAADQLVDSLEELLSGQIKGD